MSTIKALVEVEIFDDPELCDRDYRTKKYKKCPNLDFCGCMGFPDHLLKMPITRRLRLDEKLGCYIKCDQCKEVWFDTKNMDVSDIIMKITEATNKLNEG